MDENSVDVTLTSPPYYDLKDYRDSRQLGVGQSYESYKSDLTGVFSNVLKVTKDTGSMWVVVDNLRIKAKLTLLPLEMAEWIRSCGWMLQDVLVWDKIKSRPVNRGLGLRKVYEHILVFSKTKKFKRYLERVRSYDLTQWWVKWPERYKSAGKAPSDIWSFLIPSQGNWSRWPIFKHQKLHECPFPPELVEQVLLLSTDQEDMVLDPFAGSGMTLAVANCMKRNFTGFEVNGTYVRNFWDQLMPTIKYWYQEKSAQMLLSPDDIEERLEKLKKLKFARTLSQKLIAEVPAFRPASTFVLQKDNKIDVHLLYDDSIKPLDGSVEVLANKVVQNLLEKRDLKTFRVDARTRVLSAGKFVNTMKDSLTLTPLWLYKRHHMWESSTKFDEWAAKYNDEGWKERYFMGKSPPIVSNIDIFQKVVDLRKPSSTE